MIRDAIVVGAGLSGLVCARRLVAAGRDVVVVEARDRVGGRLVNGRLAGTIVDLGGQWLSVDQPRLAALAAELGVATYPHRRDGRVFIDDRARGVPGKLAIALAQWRAMRRIVRTSRADRAALDATSLGAWLERTIRNPVARDRIAMHAELVFAADPADLSLLHYLATFDVTGGFGPRGPELPGGGREHGFTGGAQALALALADQLGPIVHLGEPVRRIEDSRDAVTVQTAAVRHVARRVVLAVPPVLARDIDMPLPPAARRLAAASRGGAVIKCFAAYDRAFWRDAGWSGEGYRPRGTVRATVELGHGDPPALLAFVVGRPAVAWRDRDPAARRAEILETFVDQFGSAAAAPLDYLEVDWSVDPWSAGCVACLPPGVLATGATWRAPHGRIHFAGTETARVWPGYMEGAIEAGERAAAELVVALDR